MLEIQIIILQIRIIFIIEAMSSRREKLRELKQHINRMKTELTQESSNTEESKWTKLSHFREMSVNRQYNNTKSKQSRHRSQQSSLSKTSKRNKQKEEIQHNLNSTLKDIINKIDTNYYKNNPAKPTISTPSKAELNRTAYVGQRYRYNRFGMQGGSMERRQSKLKTFAYKKTDTILNPERQESKGIKIVRKVERSPTNMLTQNPKSNSNLYLFNTQPVFIQRKSHIQDKNRSSIALSPSTLFMIPKRNADSQEKHLTSQKKHYSRHIQENICSGFSTAF